MEKAVKILGKENEIKIHAVQDVKEAIFEFGTIDVYDMKLVDMEKHMYGKVSKMCGEAAFQYVVKVIDLAMKNEIDATVTNAKKQLTWRDIIIQDIQKSMQTIHIQINIQ